jgi:hypothetical protein
MTEQKGKSRPEIKTNENLRSAFDDIASQPNPGFLVRRSQES